jgi:uncharacterized protein
MSGHFVIDSLAFALEGKSIDGAVDVSTMPRLKDALRDDSGTIHYSLRGSTDDEGKPVIELDLSGSLMLECQRCLNALDFSLRMHERLIVARSEPEMARILSENDDRECILANPRLSVSDLVEDEILLGLPISARHSDCAFPSAEHVSP